MRIDVSSTGAVSGSFHPTTLTAVLVALIWLPALVGILALAGGVIKTPAGEASTAGLFDLIESLDPDSKRNYLPSLLAALNSPELVADPERRLATRSVRRDLEFQLAAATPRRRGVREQLDDYATEYEQTRTEMPSGTDRTLRMTSLMAEARAIARASPLPLVDVQNMLASARDGERVIALALIQDKPDPRLFDRVNDAITGSRSAFEQYQALGAAFELLAGLNHEQREQLAAALRQARDDPVREISVDASRARLVDALLRQIEVAG